MNGVRRRLARAVGAGSDAAALEQLTRRVDDLDERTRGDIGRQDTLTRQAVADLTERLAAIERRITALEARVE